MRKLDYIADGQMSLFDDGFLEESPKVTPEWTCAFTTPVVHNGEPAFQTEDGQVVSLGDEKPICQFSGHVCNKQSVWEVADTLDDKGDCPHVCCRKCKIKGCGARCNGSEEPKQQMSTEVTKKSCSNCLRFNMEIEQPPDGWGHIGYCIEHHNKTNDISSCSSWEPKPVDVLFYSAKEYAKAIVEHLIKHCREWGMSEKIEKLREKKEPDTFHKLFCKITRTYYVPLGGLHFDVEFCKDNTVKIKRCGRDYNDRPLDAVIDLQDVLDGF